ncbi:MAG TPA: TonB-dependent receptor [Terriglobia bacterium]|nr:TonB-dependent receptor [Terriglobia bacterium]
MAPWQGKISGGQRTLCRLALVMFCLPGLDARAQSAAASLSGTVQSQAGTPIASAAVILTHLPSGFQHTASSDESGRYHLPALPPATYRLQAAKPGFALSPPELVELPAGSRLAKHVILAEEPEPKTGEASSSPPASPQATSASGGQISDSQLAGLPLNGRSYSQLATLQAGVTDSAAGSASRGVGGGSLTVAGGRSDSNNFLMDGVNIMNGENLAPRSAAGVQLGSDAVLQVQVFATTYGAEYGRSSGGVLNSISRAGGSDWHATVFEYFRNSKLDARNFFDGAEAPPFKRNQFGATVSGPLLPDKTFFLASFEAMRDWLNATDVSFFPDAAIRQSPGIDPRVKPYLDLYPVPNDISIGGGIGRNLAPQPLPTDENFFTIRLDQKLTERDGVFLRYTFDDATSQSPQDTYLFSTVTNSRQQYLTLVGSHIFSPQTLASYRIAFTRPASSAESVGQIEIDPSLYFLPGAAQFGMVQVPGLNTLGPSSIYPRGDVFNTFQYAADLIAQRGAHRWKAGIDIHRYRTNSFSDWNKAGVWAFNSLASFLQAGPVGTSVTVALPGSDNHHAFRQTLLGAYVQDEYRLSPRLSLSLGLRFETASEIRDVLRRAVYLADPLRDTAPQVGRYFRNNPSAASLSPRLGFSWSPRAAGNTTISGGFGIFYDQVLTYVPNNRKSSAPFHNILVNPNAELAAVYFPDIVAAAGDVPPQIQIVDYHDTVLPTVFRYTVSVQQRLAGGWQAQASYVGARGNHLFRRYERNQFPLPEIGPDGSVFFPPQCAAAGVPSQPRCRPYAGPINPALGAVSIISTDAQSFYNAMQLSASKSLSQGLSLQASYTFSKSVDDSSTGGSTNFGQYALMRTLDRGLSDFDIRHRLVLNFFYNLPFGSGRPWLQSGWYSHLLGGWRIGGISSWRTGTPFSPGLNVRYKDYLFIPTRPNLIAGQNNNPTAGVSRGCGRIPAGQAVGTAELYFDPCVFAAPPPGTLGNAGRNTMISPDIFSMDLSLQKEFLIDARRRLQFRTEIFNFPNHTNFNAPSGGGTVIFTGENAGYNSRAGRITQTNTTSRQVQFALRLSF